MVESNIIAALAPLEGRWLWGFTEGAGVPNQEHLIVIHGGEITEDGELREAVLVDGQIRMRFEDGDGELRFTPERDNDDGIMAEVWLMPAGWDDDGPGDPAAEMRFFEHAYMAAQDE